MEQFHPSETLAPSLQALTGARFNVSGQTNWIGEVALQAWLLMRCVIYRPVKFSRGQRGAGTLIVFMLYRAEDS